MIISTIKKIFITNDNKSKKVELTPSISYFKSAKYEKLKFKSIINGLAFRIKLARRQSVKYFRKEKIYEGAIFQNFGNDLSKESRHTLLAYNFIRGIPYHNIEKKCRPDNKPKPELIEKIIREVTILYPNSLLYSKFSIDHIKSWLEVI